MLSLRCQSYSTHAQKTEIVLDPNVDTNLEVEVGQQCKSYIFQSKDEMSRSLSKLCYGNLYVIGSIWIEAMTKVMVGKRMCVAPRISAATHTNDGVTADDDSVTPHEPGEECIPIKPPDMRYSELPLYCSPHRDYNEYMQYTWCNSHCSCPILQRLVYPYVRQARISIEKKAKESNIYLSENLCVVRYMVAATLCEVQEHMRNPCNRVKAKACVALSTATGVVLGYKKGYLKAIFYGGLGALASGTLSFPKETDIVFRNVCHATWSMMIQGHNIFAGKENCEKETYPYPNTTPKCPEEEVICCPKNANRKPS